MSKSPAFQLYPKDFITDGKVKVMSNEVFGMYVKLLFQDWIDDGIIDDKNSWLKLADYDHFDENGNLRDEQDTKIAIAQLSRCFDKHPTKDGYATNGRIQRTRKEQEERRIERSESGKKGAMSKWGKNLVKHGSAIDQPMAKMAFHLHLHLHLLIKTIVDSMRFGTSTQTRMARRRQFVISIPR